MDTAADWRLTETHRLAQNALVAGMSGAVRQAMRALDFGNLDGTFPRYVAALAPVVQARRAASAALGLSYYAQARELAGETSDFVRLTGAALDPSTLLTSMSVTGPGTVKRALSRGATRAEAASLAEGMTTRAMTRHALDGGREAILATSYRDSASDGWMRVSDGRPCAFCAMLVGRGAVYSSGTATFKSHDGCGCTAKPLFSASARESAMQRELQALWNASGKHYSGDRAVAEFRRAYDGTIGRGTLGKARKVAEKTDDVADRVRSLKHQLDEIERTRLPDLERRFAAGETNLAGALEWNRSRVAEIRAELGKLEPKVPGLTDQIIEATAPLNVDANGYFAREHWPEWARQSDLGELLDRLPADRDSIGAAKHVTVAPVTEAEAIRYSREEWARLRAGGLSWDDFEEIGRESERRLPEARRRLDEATQAMVEFERKWKAEQGAGMAYFGDAADEADRLRKAWRNADLDVAAMESDAEDYQRALALTSPGGKDYYDPAGLTAKRQHEANAYNVEVDPATGLPTGEFAQHLDTLDAVGRTVDAEVERRWAERYPDKLNPLKAEAERERMRVRREEIVQQLAKLPTREDLSAETRALLASEWKDEMKTLFFTPPTDEVVELHAALTREVVAEIRPMSSADTAKRLLVRGDANSGEWVQRYGPFTDATDEVMAAHWDGFTHFPDAWGARFSARVGDSTPYRVVSGRRGYNAFQSRQMVVSGSGGSMRATAVHEIGHGMEWSHPALNRVEFGLLSRRAKRATSELWDPAFDIYGNGPGLEEWSVPSTFKNPYTSKVYGTGGWKGLARQRELPNFEVFTTGTQVVYPRTWNDVERFYDPEFRASVLGWLVGL